MKHQTQRRLIVRLGLLGTAMLLMPVGLTAATATAARATVATSGATSGATPRGDMGSSVRAGIKVSQVRISRSGKLTARIAWDQSLIARPGRYDRFHIRLLAFSTNPKTAPVQVLRRSSARVRSSVEFVKFSIPRRYAKALNGASDVVLSVSQQYATPKSRGKSYSRNDISTTHLRKRKAKSADRSTGSDLAARTDFLAMYEPKGKTTSIVTFEGHVNLGKMDATGAVLPDANLTGASAKGANLKSAVLEEAQMSASALRDSNLKFADLKDSDLRNSDLPKVKAESAKFDGSDLREVNAAGGDFSGSSMKGVKVDGADFKGADMRDVNGIGTNWATADLAGADTTGSTGISVVSAQSITFPAMPDTLFDGLPPTPAATASSGLPVTYSTSGPSACSVTGSGEITFLSVGPCVILADQAGNSSYSAAPQVSQAFLIIPLTQTLTFGAPPVVSLSTPGTVSATSDAVGATVVYTSITPSDCSVDPGTGEVTGLISGTNNCTIQASSAPVGVYGPAMPVQQVLSIDP